MHSSSNSPVSRRVWVDCAKGLGILLVVYGHVSRGVLTAGITPKYAALELIDEVIYSFHMPLFFFLSGLFVVDSVQSRGLSRYIANRVDVILYPYVVWSILQGLAHVWLSDYSNERTNFSDVMSLAWHPRAQFWYLYALFVFAVLAALVVVARRSKSLPIFAAFTLVLYLFSGRFDYLPELPANAIYYVLGILYSRSRFSVSGDFYTSLVPLTASFCLAQYIFHISLGMSYRDVGPAALALALLSIGFVVSLCMWLSEIRVRSLAYFGACSMAIYLMHIMAGSGVRIALAGIFNVDNVFVHLALGTVLGVALPLLAVEAGKRINISFLFQAPSHISAERTIWPGRLRHKP